MNEQSHSSFNNPADETFSGFAATITESFSREFTEVTLYRQTEAHQLFRAKRFGRWYLLKALRPEFRGDAFHQQMLQKEMQVLMQLQHPNIVGCVGMEQLPDYTDSEGRIVSVGTCIVLEYIDGQTLAECLASYGDAREGASSQASVRACSLDLSGILSELLDALAYLHSCGITHRDLKPSNILLTRHGKHAKLIDFSLADTDSHAILKQPAGTPRYMAPEQLTSASPDPRNDIYSLGVILSEMPLKGLWTDVARRCQLPLEQRYPSVEALRADIARRQRRRSRLRWAAALTLPLLFFVGLISFLVASLPIGGNDLSRRTTRALSQLEDSIQATHLTEHIDTLSSWRYLDPAVNDKILAVNAFIYDYVDQQPADLQPRDRNALLCTMLDRWQSWHDHIARRVKYLIDK